MVSSQSIVVVVVFFKELAEAFKRNMVTLAGLTCLSFPPFLNVNYIVLHCLVIISV